MPSESFDSHGSGCAAVASQKVGLASLHADGQVALIVVGVMSLGARASHVDYRHCSRHQLQQLHMLSFADIFTCFRVRAVFVCGGAAMALAKAGIPEDKGGNIKVRDYSLDGLAVAWDNCRVVRQRLRNRSNLLRHRCPKLKESFNTKVERSAFNVREKCSCLTAGSWLCGFSGCGSDNRAAC